ncbi:MAG: endonuclease III domain-containing protein [Thermodesulfobacteriota bacterium]
MKRRDSNNSLGPKLTGFFYTLFSSFGPQHWWPAKTRFEVVIGAILTQNTSWKNVEKAISNLLEEDLLDPNTLISLEKSHLAGILRPAGYFNIKTRRVKAFLSFLVDEYDGELNRLFKDDLMVVRDKLLDINGIGPETADSILLYAGEYPIFVVDAYTIRIMARHGIVSDTASYNEVQEIFMTHLPADPKLFNEYHALLVKVGKDFCKKREPLCSGCPLEGL